MVRCRRQAYAGARNGPPVSTNPVLHEPRWHADRVCDLGSGPPLVRPAHWISHLNADWDSPVCSPWLSFLSKSRTLIRYDQRGCGLSDREGVEFSFEKYVEDLEAVMAATGFQRFAMFGLDGGAATLIAYAARHPEQVTHLAIHGCYTRGRIARSSTPEQHAYAETQLNAVALGWGAEIRHSVSCSPRC